MYWKLYKVWLSDKHFKHIVTFPWHYRCASSNWGDVATSKSKNMVGKLTLIVKKIFRKRIIHNQKHSLNVRFSSESLWLYRKYIKTLENIAVFLISPKKENALESTEYNDAFKTFVSFHDNIVSNGILFGLKYQNS